MREWKRK